MRVVDLGEAPIANALERLGKAFSRINAEFLSKIFAAHAPELELQNELANEPLIVGRRQRAIDRQLARVHRADVRFEVVVVLIMRPADVTEARHAQREQIRARPEFVAIKELRVFALSFTAV